ncbi:MAG TPA: hypothetical protein VK666_07090 [Chryseolinea sp.]|nr:hypothetical protein [Chryseolinea sp.]
MENVITKIRNELIRAVSGIDAWFDKDEALLNHKHAKGEKTCRELLHEVMMSNRYLLQTIDNGRTSASSLKSTIDVPLDEYRLRSQELLDAAINKKVSFDFQSKECENLQEVRAELREQLDRCLIHLELLIAEKGALFTTSLSVGSLGCLDVYQSIYFMAVHVRLYLGQLDAILADYNHETERA